MLGDLHRVIPHSEYTQLDLSMPITKAAILSARDPGPTHSVAEDKPGLELLSKIPGMVADPQVAAEVARVFGKKASPDARRCRYTRSRILTLRIHRSTSSSFMKSMAQSMR